MFSVSSGEDWRWGYRVVFFLTGLFQMLKKYQKYNYLQMSEILNEMNTYYTYSFDTDYEPMSSDEVKSNEEKEVGGRDQQTKSKNTGHWNHTEKELYFIFLKEHRENFLKKQNRRTDKIFKVMARFVKTRAADQCRSHHQKMEKKFITIDAILASAETETPFMLQQIKQQLGFNNENSNYSQDEFQNCQVVETPKCVSVTESKGDKEECSELLSYEAIEKLEQSLNEVDIFSKETFNASDSFLM